MLCDLVFRFQTSPFVFCIDVLGVPWGEPFLPFLGLRAEHLNEGWGVGISSSEVQSVRFCRGSGLHWILRCLNRLYSARRHLRNHFALYTAAFGPQRLATGFVPGRSVAQGSVLQRFELP